MIQWAGVIFTFVLIIIVVVIGVLLYRESRQPECRHDQDCPAGGVCQDNKCVPHPCSTNSDCPDGQVCVNGQCLTQTCSSDSDCPQGDICSNGLCILRKTCQSDSDCPQGQICQTSTHTCHVNTTLYVKDVVAVTKLPCPEGYVGVPGYGTHDGVKGNGDLKQGTGQSTPDIYLCLHKSPGTADAIRDVIVYQFDLGSENPCPDPYQRITFNWEDKTEYNFEVGCGRAIVQTKLCQTTSGSNLLNHGPIQDMLITISDSCPSGYQLGTYETSTAAANLGANGDINYTCGGQTIRLCIR